MTKIRCSDPLNSSMLLPLDIFDINSVYIKYMFIYEDAFLLIHSSESALQQIQQTNDQLLNS